MSIITDAPRNVDVRIVDGMFLVSTVSCRFAFILVRRVGLGWNKHTQVCVSVTRSNVFSFTGGTCFYSTSAFFFGGGGGGVKANLVQLIQ